jgi:hypothetical protein
MKMRYLANIAISSRREWNSLEAEVDKLKCALKQAEEKNALLQAKLDAYETGCLYGGAHCEVCKKSRKVSGVIIYGTGCYKDHNHICTLNVPCKEFVPKEE